MAITATFATHNLAHDFHPAYATSSEHTRVPGAAHSYNIAFSDEIGHFEYCSSVAAEFGACTSLTGNDKKPGPNADDLECVDPGFLAAFGLIPVGGCFDGDADFDGVTYRTNTWPGSFKDPLQDALFHSEPVMFSSPLLTDSAGHRANFSRVAFESDMPRIEFGTTPPCQRHLSNPADKNPGQGCVNPPRARPSIRSSARGWTIAAAGGSWAARSSPARWTISAELKGGIRAHSGELLTVSGWSAPIHLRELSPDAAVQPLSDFRRNRRVGLSGLSSGRTEGRSPALSVLRGNSIERIINDRS